jgi:hypothetical protein
VLSGVAANTNCIVFDFTRPGLEPTICYIQGEHTNHYSTDTMHYIKYLRVSLVFGSMSLYNLCFYCRFYGLACKTRHLAPILSEYVKMMPCPVVPHYVIRYTLS